MLLRSLRAALVLLTAVIAASSCNGGGAPQTRTEFVFGTPCWITVPGRVSARVLDSVFTRMQELDSMMSLHNESGPLLDLASNAGVRPVFVTPELFHVIEHGIEFSAATGGAFDLTVGPLVALWGIGTDLARIPSDDEIARALSLIDYRDVLILEEQRQVALERAGMQVDLGGIAKGYGADEAADMLRANGVASALVNFGGNIYALGEKEDGTAWRIGIQHPGKARGDLVAVIPVRDRAVVTSGTYERYFVRDGRRYHHILDTTTGYPVRNGIESVTIVAASSMAADALSTGVFALGLDAGMALVDRYDGVEAVVVTDERLVYATNGVGDDMTIVDPSYVRGDYRGRVQDEPSEAGR